MIPFIPGDQMNMEMVHGLSGCFAVVLNQVQSVTAKHFLHLSRHLFGDDDGLARQLIRHLKKIGSMLLRKDQCMSLRCRTQIQDDPEVFVFI